MGQYMIADEHGEELPCFPTVAKQNVRKHLGRYRGVKIFLTIAIHQADSYQQRTQQKLHDTPEPTGDKRRRPADKERSQN